MAMRGLDSSGSREGPVSDSYENGYESLDFIKGGEFLDSKVTVGISMTPINGVN
jgi:hypothetical protein